MRVRRKTERLAELLTGEPDVKTKLILAAEALFAEGGIGGVSLREIAVAAGQGNHYAVQYHFGSREGLVRAIFDFRMRQMEATRGAMLAAAERNGTLNDARTLIEIVYVPQLALQDSSGNHHYANFLSQYLLSRRSSRYGDFGSTLPPNLARALGLLRGCVSHLPEAAAQRRLVCASFMFLNIMVTHGSDATQNRGDERFDEVLADTLQQMVVALCMPMDHRRAEIAASA